MALKINKKPAPAKSLADWYAHAQDLQVTCNTRIQDAFDLRYKTKQVFECDLATKWEEHHNENKLKDRLSEIDIQCGTLQATMRKLNLEMGRMRQEKKAVEQQAVPLNQRLGLIVNCINKRDERCGSELTVDAASVQLDKECKLVQDSIRTLELKSQEAWECLNRLDLAKFNLQLEIDDKTEARDIDREQVALTKAHAVLAFKRDALRVPKNSCTYHQWLQHTTAVIHRAQEETVQAARTRDQLVVARGSVSALVDAQAAATDYAVRRRVHEMRRATGEILDLKRMMSDNMDKLNDELAKMAETLALKANTTKLAETRLENRSYRPGRELCLDELDESLKVEVGNGRKTLQTLGEEFRKAKIAYNALSQKSMKIDENLKNKESAMEKDLFTLKIREKLANNT